MSLTYLAGLTPRLIDADKRLAAALATIRQARGTERPDPPPGYQPGPAESFGTATQKVSSRLQLEPFAFQSNRHMWQIPHAGMFTTVI